jgi:hypothetical protein
VNADATVTTRINLKYGKNYPKIVAVALFYKYFESALALLSRKTKAPKCFKNKFKALAGREKRMVQNSGERNRKQANRREERRKKREDNLPEVAWWWIRAVCEEADISRSSDWDNFPSG